VGALGRAQEALQEAFSGAPAALELRRRLTLLPGEELPRLFRLAVEGRLVLAPNGEVLPLDEVGLDAVRAALAVRPRRELVTFLDGLSRAPLELRERLEAHRLFSVAGGGEHLRLLLRLSLVPGDGLPPQELRASFVGALAAVLKRDELALEQIPSLFAESPPGLVGSVIEAVAEVTGPHATQVLARLLGRVPGLDGLLLGRLAQRADSADLCDEFVLDGLRRYLRHADPVLVVAACRALAVLGDDGAVEELIVLLERGDERVRAASGAALTTLSGLSFGLDVERWSSWFQDEQRWWNERAETELARVEGARGAEYVRAARAVLEHRLHRDRIAEAFVQALGRRAADEVWLACRALGELRSRVSLAALVECLEHEDPAVREAAWRALQAITGEALPAESASWARFAS